MKDKYSLKDIQKIADRQRKKKNYRGWFEVFNAGNVPYNIEMFNKMSGSSNSSDIESNDAASTEVDAGVSQSVGLAEDLTYKIVNVESLIEALKTIIEKAVYDSEFYPAKNGRNYGMEFFLSIVKGNKEQKKLAAKLAQGMDLLCQKGPLLRQPWTKQMRPNLYELRAKEGSNIARIFYSFGLNGKIWFFNGFIKKSDKTPEVEIEKAFQLKESVWGDCSDMNALQQVIQMLIDTPGGVEAMAEVLSEPDCPVIIKDGHFVEKSMSAKQNIQSIAAQLNSQDIKSKTLQISQSKDLNIVTDNDMTTQSDTINSKKIPISIEESLNTIMDIKTKIRNLKDDEVLTLIQHDGSDFPYLKIKKNPKFDGMFTVWNEDENGEIINKVNFSSFNNTIYWAEQCDELVKSQPEGVNEAMKCKNEHLGKEEITLEYEDLPVVVYEEGSSAGYFDTDFGNWLPDEGDSREVEIDYEYSVSKSDISEVIKNELLEDPSKDIADMQDVELNQYIQDHFDELFEKYESQILNSFRDEAIDEAQEYVMDNSDLFESASSNDYFDKKAEEVQDVKLKDFWEDVKELPEVEDDYDLVDTNLEVEGLDANDPDLKFTDYEWTEEDPEAASTEWEEVASKNVFDSDGFLTDYVWYTNGDKHVFVFGDSDRYRPEDGDFDWEIDIVRGKEAEGYREAQDWFNSYKGFEDESLDFDDINLDESNEEKDSLVFDDIESEKDTSFLTEGQMKDLDIDIKNSRSKEELIEKLEKHIAALQSELSFLQDYAPREIGRGGTFDSMEEIEEAIKLTETTLAKESAKIAVLKGRFDR